MTTHASIAWVVAVVAVVFMATMAVATAIKPTSVSVWLRASRP